MKIRANWKCLKDDIPVKDAAVLLYDSRNKQLYTATFRDHHEFSANNTYYYFNTKRLNLFDIFNMSNFYDATAIHQRFISQIFWDYEVVDINIPESDNVIKDITDESRS